MTEDAPSTPESRPTREIVFHPLLFAAFPIISLLAHNRHEAHLAWAAGPVLAAMALACLLWCLFALILRDWLKGALPASLVVLAFFSYGHLLAPLDDPDSPHRWTFLLQLSIGAATAIAGLIALLGRLGRPVLVTRFANAVAVAVLLLPTYSLVRHELKAAGEASPGRVDVSSRSTGEKPDIYLIIPDAHGRADVLREVYGYDAEPFVRQLESLGFVVAPQSSANYSMTPLALASMLNFEYLEAPDDLPWGDLRMFTDRIRHSTLERLLGQSGYKTVAFSSGAAYSEMRHFDEYYHGLGAALGFHRMVAELTPLSVVFEDHQWWNSLLSDRERLLQTLRDVPRIARDPAPTFTFVHLTLPHPPFQFGENGEDVFAEYRELGDTGAQGRTADRQEFYAEAYRGQVIYTDRRLAELAAQILEQSSTPPVIIIMSDHGPRLNLHWQDSDATDVREVLSNFTAVYLPPGLAEEAIYPTITPVNVMRIVANEALGADFALLQDRAFLSTDEDRAHRIQDVTVRLSSPPTSTGSLADQEESERREAPGGQQQRKQSADQWLAPVDARLLVR